MSFTVRVGGTADLHTLRQRMAAVGQRGLGPQMSRALNRTVAPLTRDIRAEAVRSMPSGYGPTLSRSMRFRQQARGSGTRATVTVRVWAQGRSQRRYVPDANAGRIRHPRWGDRTRWYTQQVQPGFVDRPFAAAGPHAARQMQDVIDHVARQIGA